MESALRLAPQVELKISVERKVRARKFLCFGGKVGQVSERPGWDHDGAYYRNRKREAKDFEKV